MKKTILLMIIILVISIPAIHINDKNIFISQNIQKETSNYKYKIVLANKEVTYVNGTSYTVEPGTDYKVYNNKTKKLVNKKATIKGKVDFNKTGNYEVSFQIIENGEVASNTVKQKYETVTLWLEHYTPDGRCPGSFPECLQYFNFYSH